MGDKCYKKKEVSTLRALHASSHETKAQHRLKDPSKLDFHSYWHFMEHEFDHAGFVETSIMLAISDKVKMKKAKKGFITKGLSEKEIQRIKKLSTQARWIS